MVVAAPSRMGRDLRVSSTVVPDPKMKYWAALAMLRTDSSACLDSSLGRHRLPEISDLRLRRFCLLNYTCTVIGYACRHPGRKLEKFGNN